jgi:Predicted acyl-CoA transferases/carnitine dehydratase
VTAEPLKKPFAGLRVADLAWVGVGPSVSKYLADHGAEVIRVESGTYPDPCDAWAHS